MKHLSLFLLFLIVFTHFIFIENRRTLSCRKNKSIDEILGEMNNKKKKDSKKIPNGILWSGWVKYIHFTGDGMSHPKTFFQNKKYLTQIILKSELKKKDTKGHYIHIPTYLEFWGTLRKNEMIFTSSRTDVISHNHDSLLIDSILPLGKNVFKSSIRNLGDFSEGSCIQIFTNVPKGYNKNFKVAKDIGTGRKWIICMNDKVARDKLLNNLISLKASKQKAHPEKENKSQKNIESMVKALEQPKKSLPIEVADGARLIDGYWLLLQDWSQCTLKCGGGKTVQHWMCVPPKTGGKPCQGKAIREKPCNMQPCPNTSFQSNSTNSKVKNKVLKPIIKVIPFSTRPQIMLKCVRKESDVFYLWQPNPSVKLTKRPARVIINTRTISLYNDESHPVFTFDLQKTNISQDKQDSCCFNINSETRQFTICGGFSTPCSLFYSEWNNDFMLFKVKCYERQKELNVKSEITKQALDDASRQAGMADSEEKTAIIKKHLEDNENNNIEKQLVSTESLALKAMSKELNIEKMLQDEFRMKAEIEFKKINERKLFEKKKQVALNKLLKDQEQEISRNREKKQAQMQLQKIKDDAKKQVEVKRELLKKKIRSMQKKLDRKKRMVEQEIYTIRNQMARNLMDANRNGDMMNCKNSYGDIAKMKKYCDSNIIEDYRKNTECKNTLNFCYICCENEYGSMMMSKRDECYNICDTLASRDLDHTDFRWG